MPSILTTLLAIIASLRGASGGSSSSSPSPSLAAEIEAITSRAEYEGCRWGIAAHRVAEEDDQEVIYENGDAASYFTPASNLKLLTCYAAWRTLGADYSFSTPLAASFADDDDAGINASSAANLTLCGANDPSLTSAALELAVEQAVAADPRLRSAASLAVRVDNRRGSDGTFPSSWEFGVSE